MKITKISYLMMILFAAALFSCAEKEEKKEAVSEEKSEHLASARHVTTIMTVKEINLEERLFTLEYSEGNEIVVRVEPNLVGIEEINVGDKVEVKYFKSLVVFVDSPENRRPPVSEKKTVTTATEDGEPVEYIVDVVEKVSTVMAIDHQKREAVLRDSEGNMHEVDISHEVENAEDVKVGDQVVYHFTESIAIHVAKI